MQLYLASVRSLGVCVLVLCALAAVGNEGPFVDHGSVGPVAKPIESCWQEVIPRGVKVSSHRLSSAPFVLFNPSFTTPLPGTGPSQENNPMRLYYSIPNADHRVVPVCGFSAREQYDSLIFGVFANEALSEVKFSVSALVNEHGTVFPANHLELRVERLIPKMLTYDWKKQKGTFSYINGPLEKLSSIPSVPVFRSRYIWLLSYVSSTQEAGIYQGKVSVTANGHTETLPLRLEVYPFSLPENRRPYGLFLSGNPWSTSYLKNLHAENWQRMFSLWHRYGINYLPLYITGNAVECDFHSMGVSVRIPEMDRVVEMFSKAGCTGPMALEIGPVARKCADYLKQHPECRKKDYELLAEVIRALMNKGKERHWPRIYFIPGEESSKAPKWFAAVKLAGGTTLSVDNAPHGPGAFGRSWSERWLNDIDVTQYNQFSSLLTARAKASGRKLWAYNLGYDRLKMGLCLDAHEVEGYAQWAEQWPLLDPYHQLSTRGESRCWMTTYPSGNGYMSSGNLEVMRTAIDDSRYYQLLEKLLGKVQLSTPAVRDAVQQARQVMDDLRRDLPESFMEPGHLVDVNRKATHYRRRLAKGIMTLMRLSGQLKVSVVKTGAFVLPPHTRALPNQAKRPGEAGYAIENLVDHAILTWVPSTGDVQGAGMRNAAFRMGNSHGGAWEHPVHDVALTGFWMYQTEVTVGQWRQFLRTTGYDPKPRVMSYDRAMQTPEEQWNGPEQMAVTFVSRDHAMAYARWAGGHLPTEAQWEWAAKGPEGLDYTWGNDWQPEKIGYRGSRPAAQLGTVWSCPEDRSWCGVVGLLSGVREWIHDRFNAYENYYEISPRLNPSGFEQSIVIEAEERWNIGRDRSMYAIRGGCSLYGTAEGHRTTARVFCDFGFEIHSLTGFRLVMVPVAKP